eukprot:m.4000 g.4000  ORF g.4000 m.4000 type:complete len:93 (-) comp4383_c0_seq1:118-396(-)
MAADPQLQRLINRIGEASQQFTALASKTEASMTELKASHEQTMAQDKGKDHVKIQFLGAHNCVQVVHNCAFTRVVAWIRGKCSSRSASRLQD